jgi:hypothetical protein
MSLVDPPIGIVRSLVAAALAAPDPASWRHNASYAAEILRMYSAFGADASLCEGAPLLAPAAAAGKGVSAFSIKVGSADLKIGQVIAELVNLIVSFALVVFTIGLLRSYVLTRIGAKRGGGEQ